MDPELSSKPTATTNMMRVTVRNWIDKIKNVQIPINIDRTKKTCLLYFLRNTRNKSCQCWNSGVSLKLKEPIEERNRYTQNIHGGENNILPHVEQSSNIDTKV